MGPSLLTWIYIWDSFWGSILYDLPGNSVSGFIQGPSHRSQCTIDYGSWSDESVINISATRTQASSAFQKEQQKNHQSEERCHPKQPFRDSSTTGGASGGYHKLPTKLKRVISRSLMATDVTTPRPQVPSGNHMVLRWVDNNTLIPG